MEVQSGTVCTRGIVYSVTQATIALSSAESEFYATGSATARDCSARFTCLKRNDLVNWTCTTTAQLGAACANGQASAKYATWSCDSCGYKNG